MSEHLHDFVESNPTSRKLFEAAVTCLAGGVVHENPYTGGLTSLAHTEEDVRQTVRAFEGAVTELLGQSLLERR